MFKDVAKRFLDEVVFDKRYDNGPQFLEDARRELMAEWAGSLDLMEKRRQCAKYVNRMRADIRGMYQDPRLNYADHYFCDVVGIFDEVMEYCLRETFDLPQVVDHWLTDTLRSSEFELIQSLIPYAPTPVLEHVAAMLTEPHDATLPPIAHDYIQDCIRSIEFEQCRRL